MNMCNKRKKNHQTSTLAHLRGHGKRGGDWDGSVRSKAPASVVVPQRADVIHLYVKLRGNI